MSVAAIPIVAGAAAGAMMDDEKPLRGAFLGGAMGGMGGAALSGMGAMGGAASGAGGMAGTAGAYGALPGMAAPSAQTAMLASQGAGLGMSALPAATSGSQAAMLAAQTGEFGLPGLLATGEAAAAPGSMAGGAFGMGKNLAFGGGGDNKMMQAGQAIGKMGGQPQQQRQAPVVGMAPQINPNAGGQFMSPYDRKREEERMNAYTYGQPSILPSFRR